MARRGSVPGGVEIKQGHRGVDAGGVDAVQAEAGNDPRGFDGCADVESEVQGDIVDVLGEGYVRVVGEASVVVEGA